MLSPRRRLGAAGVVAFAVLVLAPAAAAASAAGTTPHLGSHAMIETNMAPATVDGLFAATRQAHLGIVRVDVAAALLFRDAPDRPDWSSLDVVRSAARAQQLDVLGLLFGVPAWLARCPPGAKDLYRCPPSDYAAWGRIVRRIAARAPEIRYWEVLNEANLPNGFFYGDAVEYAHFLRVTSAAVRRGNPQAKIVFTGVIPPFEPWLDHVLSQPGVMRSFDIANAHFRGGPGKLDDMVRGARAHFGRFGFTGPLWVTETGYTSDPVSQWIPEFTGGDAAAGEQMQARYMAAAIPVLLRSGADRVFVTLRDLDTDWGIFTSEGLLHWPVPTPKPAYFTVASIAGKLARLASGAAARGHAPRGSGRGRAPRRRARAPRRGSAPRRASHASR